jgi:hypothetical protein
MIGDTVMSLLEAFHEACENAQDPEGFWVSLYQRSPYYGGPEEGGWWGQDTVIVSYKYYPTKEAAEAAMRAVEKLAKSETQRALDEYGEQCQRESEWLDERGLDDNYLSEPDGPDEYFVVLETNPGSHCVRGQRHYE